MFSTLLAVHTQHGACRRSCVTHFVEMPGGAAWICRPLRALPTAAVLLLSGQNLLTRSTCMMFAAGADTAARGKRLLPGRRHPHLLLQPCAALTWAPCTCIRRKALHLQPLRLLPVLRYDPTLSAASP